MDDRTTGRIDDIAATLGLNAPKHPQARRRLLWIAAAALALVLLIGFWIFKPASVRYVSQPVTRGALTVTVSATGTLKPLNQVDVGAQISGRIVELHGDYNDHVTKDQLLALIDTAEFKARVTQSEANVANAEATLVEMRLKRDRIAALRKSGTSSREDLDAAQAAFDRAQAAVKQARALLDIDQTNLGRTEIRAPIDGIVLDRKVEVGQTVASTFQTPVLFTLAEDLTHMRLQVDVDEADVGRIHEGENALFTVDAYPDRKFAARVFQFRNAPQTSEGVVTYPVVLDVANPDLALRPGMTANAEIIAAKHTDVLLVPNGALRFTPPGFAVRRGGDNLIATRLKKGETVPPLADLGAGTGVVWTKEDGAPAPHLLKLGASDGVNTMVVSGAVKPGDDVLVDVERKPGAGGA
jgi:HlyD family secretion protein